MKKSLLAVALLGTFAASAFAAPSVTLYGRIDTGLLYTHADADTAADAVDNVQMSTGFSTGSRWGLKGTEDLGNVKVGFVLENGFNSDDGVDAQPGRMFGREALVSVSGAYGTLYAGRMSTLNSDGGSIGMLGVASPFGSGWGVASMKLSTGSSFDRYDNTLAYVSPTFAGFKGEAMYSFKADSTKQGTANENKADVTRYAAAGVQYQAGAFTGVLAGDYTMWDNRADGLKGIDDGYSIFLGGNYDFGVATVYGQATYFDNAANYSKETVKDLGLSFGNDTKAVKGWGAALSTKVPAFGGDILATVGYRDAKDVQNTNVKYERWNAGVGYTYAFSKRTNVYGFAGYAQEKSKGGKDARTPNVTQAGFGLVHKF